MHYIFVAKPRSHKYLYEELESLQKLGELQEVKRTQWNGKEHRYVTYRYINHVPLKDAENSIEVNWVQITITNEKGEVTFHTAFITSYLITEENEAKLRQAGTVRIFLGAGSTIFHLANILAERASHYPIKFCIYTHNLGVLKRLLEPDVDLKNLDLFTAKGQIDPVTYTILGQLDEIDSRIPFDYVIMGTSYVIEGLLYVESRKETGIKDAILHRVEGEKMLVLTKHEFTDQPIQGLQPYGAIRDFDSVVVPVHSIANDAKKKHDMVFEHYLSLFEPEIIHWNYMILKVTKRDPDIG